MPFYSFISMVIEVVIFSWYSKSYILPGIKKKIKTKKVICCLLFYFTFCFFIVPHVLAASNLTGLPGLSSTPNSRTRGNTQITLRWLQDMPRREVQKEAKKADRLKRAVLHIRKAVVNAIENAEDIERKDYARAARQSVAEVKAKMSLVKRDRRKPIHAEYEAACKQLQKEKVLGKVINTQTLTYFDYPAPKTIDGWIKAPGVLVTEKFLETARLQIRELYRDSSETRNFLFFEEQVLQDALKQKTGIHAHEFSVLTYMRVRKAQQVQKNRDNLAFNQVYEEKVENHHLFPTAVGGRKTDTLPLSFLGHRMAHQIMFLTTGHQVDSQGYQALQMRKGFILGEPLPKIQRENEKSKNTLLTKGVKLILKSETSRIYSGDLTQDGKDAFLNKPLPKFREEIYGNPSKLVRWFSTSAINRLGDDPTLRKTLGLTEEIDAVLDEYTTAIHLADKNLCEKIDNIQLSKEPKVKKLAMKALERKKQTGNSRRQIR